jgi:nitrogen-specific signal transduction histidine kinase
MPTARKEEIMLSKTLVPTVRANLFTPFFGTKENSQGIGLTMIQEILSQHRFEFSLDSQPGGPTQFAIFFSYVL